MITGGGFDLDKAKKIGVKTEEKKSTGGNGLKIEEKKPNVGLKPGQKSGVKPQPPASSSNKRK